MSPTRFLDGDHKQYPKSGVLINGPRPTPLKLKQESHTIHKHPHQHHQHQHQRMIRKPIIIYTYSPKVIHTKPHDFRALVQKLTGKYSGSDHQEQQKKNKTLIDGYDLNENHFCNDFGDESGRNNVMKSKSPMFDTPSNLFAPDIPLFTPNSSSDYLFSPHDFLKLSDTISSSRNKTIDSFSPGSLVEFMQRLPEY